MFRIGPVRFEAIALTWAVRSYTSTDAGNSAGHQAFFGSNLSHRVLQQRMRRLVHHRVIVFSARALPARAVISQKVSLRLPSSRGGELRTDPCVHAMKCTFGHAFPFLRHRHAGLSRAFFVHIRSQRVLRSKKGEMIAIVVMCSELRAFHLSLNGTS